MSCRHFGNPTRGLPLVKQTALSLGATQNTSAKIIQFSPARNATRSRLTQGARMLPLSFSETIEIPAPVTLAARHPLVQAVIDVAAVLAAVAFIVITGLGILAAGIILVTAL